MKSKNLKYIFNIFIFTFSVRGLFPLRLNLENESVKPFFVKTYWNKSFCKDRYVHKILAGGKGGKGGRLNRKVEKAIKVRF